MEAERVGYSRRLTYNEYVRDVNRLLFQFRNYLSFVHQRCDQCRFCTLAATENVEEVKEDLDANEFHDRMYLIRKIQRDLEFGFDVLKQPFEHMVD